MTLIWISLNPGYSGGYFTIVIFPGVVFWLLHHNGRDILQKDSPLFPYTSLTDSTLYSRREQFLRAKKLGNYLKNMITGWTNYRLDYLIVGGDKELTHDSFQGYSDIRESPLLWKIRDCNIWYSPTTFLHNFYFQIYAAPIQWRLLIFIRKNLWRKC